MSDDLTCALVQTTDTETADESPRSDTHADGFEIGSEIARGGMGIIYRGRDRALDREVAIKVLQPQFPRDGLAARRFLAEARITGQLQHPGIPPIHHVGTLADGRPFLAMKLIKGETLADARSVGDTLAVFEAICQAVGYAHAHGVIHRDLKPANVMVGMYGEVQVMDWGLSKVLADRPAATDDPHATRGLSEVRPLTGEGDQTHAGNILGTPAFMPPEQAIGANEQVDARSDVFGLGGILCVLLTGRAPYVGESSESTRQLAARAKLDAAMAALDASTADADLIALCKRCLAAEPSERPADAGAVANEVAALRLAAVERARRAEIAAAEAGVREREERKRRQVWLRGVGAVAAVLAVGVGVSSWLAVRAILAERAVSEQLTQTKAAEQKANEEEAKARESEAKARDREEKERAARTEADKQRRQAKDEAASALAIKDFVCDILTNTDPKKNATPAEIEAANRETKNKLDYAVGRLADFDGKAATEAEIRNSIGMMYDKLKAIPEAETQLKRSLELFEEAFGPNHDLTLHAARGLGGFYVSHQRWTDAEPLYRRVLSGFEKDTGFNALFGFKAAQQLAVIAQLQNRPADAIGYLRRGRPLAERATTGPESGAVLNLRLSLASALLQTGELVEAEKELRDVLALAVAARGGGDMIVSSASWGLEESLARQGKHEAAGQEIRDQLARCTAALGATHERTVEQVIRLGVYHSFRREFEQSVPLFERVVKQVGETAAACRPLLHLGSDYLAIGRTDESVAALERGERLRLKYKLSHMREHAYHVIVTVYTATGRDETLRARNRATAAEVRAVEKPDAAARADGLAYIGWSMLNLRQFEEAEPVIRECLAIFEKRDPNAWPTHNAASMLGWAKLGRGQAALAEPLLLRGYEGLKRTASTIPETFRELSVVALDRLIVVYERLDRPADVAKWRAERAKYPREAAPPPREPNKASRSVGP
jgi:tetratricopeptide (TPR) repeat protein